MRTQVVGPPDDDFHHFPRCVFLVFVSVVHLRFMLQFFFHIRFAHTRLGFFPTRPDIKLCYAGCFAQRAQYPPPPRSGSAGVCRSRSRFFQLKVLDSCSYGVRDARKSGPAVTGSYRALPSVVHFFDVCWLSWLIFGHLCRHRFFMIFPTPFFSDFGLILAPIMVPKSSQNPFKIDQKT